MDLVEQEELRENSDEVLEGCQWSDHAEQHRGNGVAHTKYARESFANVGSCIALEGVYVRKVAADLLEMERGEHVC